MDATATATQQLDEAGLSALVPAKAVDARGSACPGPLLEAKKGIGAVPVGEVLEIMSSDPQTKADIDAWCTSMRQSSRRASRSHRPMPNRSTTARPPTSSADWTWSDC